MPILKTRKKVRNVQLGRGADLTNIVPDPRDHPFVQKVLGRGGFGIVVGMPRLPLLIELDDYKTYRLAEKIQLLIGLSAPFDEYKTKCEEISHTIPDGRGRELFLKLCFEVQKFYKPSHHSRFVSRVETVILASLVSLKAEITEITDVLENFKDPTKYEILTNAGILPLVNTEHSEILIDFVESSKFKEMDTLYQEGRIRSGFDPDFDHRVRSIIPPDFLIPHISEIPEYALKPGDEKNRWVRHMFEKLKDFIGVDEPDTGRNNFKLDSVVGGDKFTELFKKEKLKKQSDITDLLEFISKYFTCITFPLANKTLTSIIMTIAGEPPGDPFERRDLILLSLPKLMKFSQNLLKFYEQGFVHNDLKTQNVMMDHLGELKFIDFGGVADARRPVSEYVLNIGSFSYPFWSSINIIRVIVDEIHDNRLPLKLENIKKEVIKTITDKNVAEINERLSEENSRLNNIRSLGLSIGGPESKLNPILHQIYVLRKTIIDAFLLDTQLKTGETLNIDKIRNVFATTFTTILDTIRTSTDTPLSEGKTIKAIQKEISLRNDVYSLGIIITTFVSALAKYVMEYYRSSPVDGDVLIRKIYELLRFAVACMSIDVRVLYTSWLPKLQALAREVGDIMDLPDVSVEDIPKTRDILPGEFPLATGEMIMSSREKSSREKIQRPMLTEILTRAPLVALADYGYGSGDLAQTGNQVAAVVKRRRDDASTGRYKLSRKHTRAHTFTRKRKTFLK